MTTRAARRPGKVTTTRVQVVEGLGREGGFDPGQIYERLAPGVVTVLSIFEGGVLGSTTTARAARARASCSTARATSPPTPTWSPAAAADRVRARRAGLRRVLRRQPGAGGDRRRRPQRRRRAAEDRERRAVAHPAAARVARTSISVGEPVAAIGSPFGEHQSLSVGVISAVDRNIESLTRFQIGNAIQTDAADQPGQLRRPAARRRGRVIGHQRPDQVRVRRRRGRGLRDPRGRGEALAARAARATGASSYGYLGVQTLVLWPQLGRAARPRR